LQAQLLKCSPHENMNGTELHIKLLLPTRKVNLHGITRVFVTTRCTKPELPNVISHGTMERCIAQIASILFKWGKERIQYIKHEIKFEKGRRMTVRKCYLSWLQLARWVDCTSGSELNISYRNRRYKWGSLCLGRSLHSHIFHTVLLAIAWKSRTNPCSRSSIMIE